MPDFPDALDHALRDYFPVRTVRSPIGTARGLAARLNALEQAYGSRRAAAEAAGVPYVTWRAWRAPKSGRSRRTGPGPKNAARVEAAYMALQRSRARRRIRAAPIRRMIISAVVVVDPQKSRYMNKIPHRDFRADKVRDWTPMVDAWTAGAGRGTVAHEARALIRDAYGSEFAFDGDTVSVDLT